MRKIYWSLLFLLPLSVSAQTLKDAVQQAVLTNPEVAAKAHAFEAADAERDVAFGAFLPRLDVSASVGRDDYKQPVQTKSTRNSTSVVLTQMIYDGFATSNEVDRLDFARRTRFFELYDATENTTLEVIGAYADVLRYRALVALAEENYVRHRSVFSQISEKANAGVGRRVDMEQAAGRLALAESNLLTDTTNLHDVSARFQRLVGSAPGANMVMPDDLNQGIPNNLTAALKIADRNPALLAAIENVRSANSAAKGRNAAFQPRLDFRLRSDRGENLSSNTGPTGQSQSNTAEFVLTWNLLNGGSDRARLRQYAEQINVARDLRDKTCRDLRQTLSIAYNDTRKLTEQLTYLDQHQLSIEKARDAYRMQFDIGQRSLLDLLDTENELFQAKRAYVNSEADLQVAYARTNAGMGNLFSSLNLSSIPVTKLPVIEEQGETATGCPPVGPGNYVVDKDALNVRAEQLVRESAAVAAAVVAARADPMAVDGTSPLARTLTPATSAGSNAPAMTNVPEVGIVANVPRKALAEAQMRWSNAWKRRDVSAYLQSYSKDFKPENGLSHDAWMAQRTAALENKTKIELSMTEVQMDFKGKTSASTNFVQKYSSDSYKDVVQKRLEWVYVDGRWLIIRETAKPMAAN
tara:strand:+ start:376814 stop:378724 length:1911 start_codon:yes stop_codon:yes gene_type:complete